MENLRELWSKEPLNCVKRLESVDLRSIDVDFELLDMALKTLYQLMGGGV
ncbi:hypothetical protein GF326_00035 [Candidatus Bathyarchaeota archaeon]|nr:hypothetical protein [Candidatus Bathyarchaeota archaeon]